MRPRSAANRLAVAAKAARSATSATYAKARPPASQMRAATASQLAPSMSTAPTVAPQLASFSATERPSPRPAPVTSTARSPNSYRIVTTAPPLLELELPAVAVAHDPARSGVAEVRADDPHLAPGIALDERAARPGPLLLVHVEVAMHLRGSELDRVMHHVAGDDGFLTARADVDADVTRRVARCRLEPHLVGDRVVSLDELVQLRLDDRVDRVDQVPEVVVATGGAQMLPVLEFLAAEEIARLRKRRHPFAVHLARVPADVVEVQVRRSEER